MWINAINKLQGKKIEIINMELKHKEGKLSLYCDMHCSLKELKIEFENVSFLSLNDVSYPFIIYGFEILDNSIQGWERDLRYEINDFENGIIHFYCEEIVDISCML